jgi:hypothetical protein
VVTELFHADGRTDGRKDGQTEMRVTVAFRDFAKAPKKLQILPTDCIYGCQLIRRTNSYYFTVQCKRTHTSDASEVFSVM